PGRLRPSRRRAWRDQHTNRRRRNLPRPKLPQGEAQASPSEAGSLHQPQLQMQLPQQKTSFQTWSLALRSASCSEVKIYSISRKTRQINRGNLVSVAMIFVATQVAS